MTVFKNQQSAAVFQAVRLVATLQARLDAGMRFRHPKTQKELKTVEEILKCIQTEGAVDQQPPGGKDG